jgi:hypothetical protein
MPQNLLTNPTVLLVFALVVLIVLARLVILLSRKSAGSEAHPYESQKVLLSPAERSFLGVLQGALGSELVVAPKVRLADVIRVSKGLSRSANQHAFNRIVSKHVDFVLCRKSDFSIAAVLELDDQSHQRQSRAARDGFVDSALAAAGIPILHVKAQAHYEPSALSTQLASLLAPPAGPAAARPRTASAVFSA